MTTGGPLLGARSSNTPVPAVTPPASPLARAVVRPFAHLDEAWIAVLFGARSASGLLLSNDIRCEGGLLAGLPTSPLRRVGGGTRRGKRTTTRARTARQR
jgi:hypothetical protein